MVRVLATFLMASQLGAQEQPDFSGRWVLESASPPDAAVPLALAVQQSIQRTTARGEPMKPWFTEITIARESADGILTETHRIGVVGGTVGGLVDGTVGRADGPRSSFSVTWRGHTLVFENESRTGPSRENADWFERRESWSLDAEGRLNVVITSRGSGDPPKTFTLVYRREDYEHIACETKYSNYRRFETSVRIR